MAKTEIAVGISGASGVQYGIRLLEIIHEGDLETHLVVSEQAKQLIEL